MNGLVSRVISSPYTAVFFAGAFGGIVPNLLRIAISTTNDVLGDEQFVTLQYILGMSLFAFLGGIVALIFKEMNLRKALYIGIGLPSLIQLNLATATRSTKAAVEFGPSAQFISTAYAQGTAVSPSLARRLKIGVIDPNQTYEIAFFSDSGRLAGGNIIANKRVVSLSVPSSATAFSISVSGSLSERYSLSANGDTIGILKQEPRPWAGFWQALGANSPRFVLTFIPISDNGFLGEVFIHYNDNSLKDVAEDVAQDLAELGFSVPPIEDVSQHEGSLKKSEVRYFRQTDQQQASWIQSVLGQVGVTNSMISLPSDKPYSAKEKHFEVFLAR